MSEVEKLNAQIAKLQEELDSAMMRERSGSANLNS